MGHGSIILPSGPVVIVYKGWRRSKRKPGDDPSKPPPRERYPTEDIAVTSMESPSTGDIYFAEPGQSSGSKSPPGVSRNFQFVNATKPQRNRDPDVRKLVRTHVMKEFGRDRRQQKRREKDRRASSSEESVKLKEEASPTNVKVVPVCPRMAAFEGSALPFYGLLPTELKPRYPKLIQYCMLRSLLRATARVGHQHLHCNDQI